MLARLMWANLGLTFYSTTAGSFIETSLSTESERPNLFIINQTCLEYTTAGSLIQSSLLALVRRDWQHPHPDSGIPWTPNDSLFRPDVHKSWSIVNDGAEVVKMNTVTPASRANFQGVKKPLGAYGKMV